MKRPRSPVALVGIFLIGISALIRTAPHVRAVDAAGLFSGGMACGAALFGFITGLRNRR